MTTLPLAARLMRRELRGGLRGFRIFLACLTLGVAVIAGVGSLAAGIRAGLEGDARAMLGGDIELNLMLRPASEAERRYLDQNGKVAEVIDMRAMVRRDDNAQRSLIELKAVDGAYPLYGSVTLDPAGLLADALAQHDGLWGAVAAPALLDRLGLMTGDIVRIGEARFQLRAALTHEPDAVTGIFILGPRFMIAKEALAGTGLVAPGALIGYGYRVRLPAGVTVDGWTEQLKTAFPDAGWRVRDYADAAPNLRRLLDRVGLFLTLLGLTALLVGGVGVGNAVSGYLATRTFSIAIFKSVGAAGRLVFWTYLLQIAVLAALGIAFGLVLGALTPVVTERLLPADLPVTARFGLYLVPLAIAAAAGALTTLAFALGPLSSARAVPPATLFREAADAPPAWPGKGVLAAQALVSAALAALVIATTVDHRMAFWSVLGAIAVLVVFRLAAALAIAAVRRIGRPRQPLLRLALANLGRRGANTAGVIASLGLGLTVLVALTLVEGNIALTLDKDLPERAPSFFFIDIQPDEVAGFDQLLAGFAGVSDVERVPSLRGRLVKLNDVPVEHAAVAPGAQWAVRSERGLTYAPTVPTGSRVVEGKWWPADYKGPPLVSFDAELARGMGLKIGDTLTVNVLGRDVTAEIANLRTIDWTSLRINYALVFSPGTFAGAPETFIATARVPPQQESALQKAVTDRFANISAIPVKDALQAVGQIVAQVAVVLKVTAAIALGAAGLVLAGALAASRRRRLYEAVVLKVLGATRRDLVAAFLLEYGLLGLLAAAVASVLGTVAAYLVLTEIMRTDWVFLPGAAALSAAAALVLTLVLGYAGTWRALGASPTTYLRND
ncbi:MAG TPA: FtsX-like permease family protein [Stellaceae bacterium]|nr:FtsX-like permease family protein [Stellaceae bacterium]